MEKEKLRSNGSPARRPHASKRPVDVDWEEEQTLSGLGHEESTSVLNETESQPGTGGSINQFSSSTEVNKPESHLENEAARNGRDHSVAEMDQGSGPEFSMRQLEHDAPDSSADELLETINKEIEELMSDIDDSIGGARTDETEAVEETENDVSATLTEGGASDFQESAESEIATIPSVEEIIATMEEDPLVADEDLLEPEADLAEDLESAPIEDDLSASLVEESLLADEDLLELEADLAEDLESAPIEDDLSASLVEDSLLADEDLLEPEADLAEDLESAPVEDDLSVALVEDSLLADEDLLEPEADLAEDLESAPIEDDLSAALDEDSLLADEDLLEPEADLAEDLESAPVEDDLSAALDEDSLLADEDLLEPEADLAEDLESASVEDDLSASLVEDSFLAVEEEVQPEEDLKVDLEPVPSLEDLISEIDSKIGRALDPHQSEEGAASQQTDQESRDQGKYIRFLLDDMLMAVPLSSALEVGHRPDITPLPNLPDWILGVSNIRGEIVSVLDLKGFFGRSSSGPGQGNRLIIIHNQDLKVGIIVDGIMGIISLDRLETDIQPNPYSGGDISSFVSGVVVSEEKILNILDVDRLLTNPRMTDF